jgi:WD40 repeat protein
LKLASSITPDSKNDIYRTQLASASDDSIVKLWDARSGATLHTFKGHSYSVIAMAFSPDETTLASVSADTSDVPKLNVTRISVLFG